MKILKAVILVELEDKTVHQAIIKENLIRQFLTGVSSIEGHLKVSEDALEGITLERG